jgi:hypothetical protein
MARLKKGEIQVYGYRWTFSVPGARGRLWPAGGVGSRDGRRHAYMDVFTGSFGRPYPTPEKRNIEI